jgi:predicted phosphodiesterase
MKIVIFSDLHSNISALKSLVKKEGRYTKYICNGDLIGYLPYNNECIEFFIKLDHVWIRGNHEQMFINGKYDEHCSSLAKEFFGYSFKFYDKKYDILLKNTLESFQVNEYVCQHTLENKYLYPNSDFEILSMVGKYIIGHSHIQFQKNNDELNVINTGSLGQNRKNLSKCEYLVIENNEISLKYITIDFSNLIKELEDYQYPSHLVEYYIKLLNYKEN